MRNTLSRNGTTAGFTLIEQLVAASILGLALLGTTRLFAEALRSLRDSRQHRAAIVHGEDLLERVVAIDMAATLGAGTCTVGQGTCANAAAYSLPDWLAALRDAVPDAAAELNVVALPSARRITLRISWTDSRGATTSRQLERSVRQ